MAEVPTPPAEGWQNLDPKLYTSIVLATMTTALVRKGVLSVQEATELGSEITKLATDAAAMSPPIAPPGSARD